MKLREIIDFIEKKIPKTLALDSDEVGFKREYDLEQDITSIKIYMDLLPENDVYTDNTLIITHHPPLFIPKTPTYIIHTNWDVIEGGANEALADTLNLEVIDYFDQNTKIGRICKANQKFSDLKKNIGEVGIISGFGLKNPNYIMLAKSKRLDILISGDLTQETSILAKNLEMTLIDLNHHESEVPGLYALAEILKELKINVEIVDKKPIEKLEIQ